MEIYLIRHTTPKVDKGVCYGQSDLELSDTFSEELDAVLHKIPDDFDRVFSSPLHRCSKLAMHISADATTDPRLMELDFGEWENKRWEDIELPALNRWMDDFVNIPPPKGESFIDLQNRVVPAWTMITKQEVEKIAIVTHAGVIRVILSEILGFPLQNAFKIKLDYGKVSKIQISEGLCTLEYINV